MNPNDVIESYVVDVMRRIPGKDRNEVGLELRGLLTEMLEARAQAAGLAANDAMVLGVLQEFGTPADIASRYRTPRLVVIPAEQTHSFAILSIVGITLQWALTLPQVGNGNLAIGGWWLSWGLGALWWPGFMAMMALMFSWLRSRGLFIPKWTPRIADPDRLDRGGMIAGLVSFAIAMSFMIALPWLVGLVREPFHTVFAFDPEFLRIRAWPVLVVWTASYVIMASVVKHGRHTVLTRRLGLGISLSFIALLCWWLTAGEIFIQRSTNDGARGGIALVILFIVIDVTMKFYRGRPRITEPHKNDR